MIDKDEYPQTAEFERRCVNIIGRLWHAPGDGDVTGMLDHRLERGRDARRAGAEVALARADEGGRQADRPAEPGHWASTCRSAGRSSAATGTSSRGWCRWRATASISAAEAGGCAVRREHDRRRGGPRVDVRRQLRAGRRDLRRARRAGGRRRPRCAGPRRRRLRRVRRAVRRSPISSGTSALPRVQSINASGHKYGLVYPGVGWAIWRDAARAAAAISCSTSTTSADRCRRSR